ncbi:unnamed protein product [Peronospora belbahrii]|uniref:Uncharacterized protein n=1 Tax=Peronospora belbahrii TaxID=622444 RepID=A0AAU9L0J2_9STRA|nr:unnamed protein product [Peronospora belbahrii]
MRLGAPNLAKLRNMRQNPGRAKPQQTNGNLLLAQQVALRVQPLKVVTTMSSARFSDDPGVPILEAIVDGKIVVASISTVRSSPRYKSFHDMCRCRKNGHLPQGSNPSKSELA